VGGIGCKPRTAVAQTQKNVLVGASRQFSAGKLAQCAVGIQQRAPAGIQRDDAGLRPRLRQCGGVIPQVVGTIQCTIDKGKRSHAYTVKLLPQPQVVLALGLRITNCAPAKDSL